MLSKKILLSLSVLALGAPTVSSASTQHFKTGAYVGLTQGINLARTKFSTTYTADPVQGGDDQRETKSVNNSAFSGEMSLGGRYLLNNGFFPGFEIAASFANDHIKRDFQFVDADLNLAPGYTLRTDLKRRYSIVPSVVLGWVVSEQFNVFAKLGVGISQYDLRLQQSTYEPLPSASLSKTKYSFVPSVGLEYSFSRFVSFVASLSCDIGGKINLEKKGLFDFGVPYNDKADLSVRANFFTQKIGLLIKF